MYVCLKIACYLLSFTYDVGLKVTIMIMPCITERSPKHGTILVMRFISTWLSWIPIGVSISDWLVVCIPNPYSFNLIVCCPYPEPVIPRSSWNIPQVYSIGLNNIFCTLFTIFTHFTWNSKIHDITMHEKYMAITPIENYL